MYSVREYCNCILIIISLKTCTPFSIVAITNLPFPEKCRRVPFFYTFCGIYCLLTFGQCEQIPYCFQILICVSLMLNNADFFSCDFLLKGVN